MAKKIFKFELGTIVKDKHVPDYQGQIMSRTQYLTGCVQYDVLNPTLDKDGEVRSWCRYDEGALVKVSASKAKKPKNPGGPQPSSRNMKQ